MPAKSPDAPFTGDLSSQIRVDLGHVPGVRRLAVDYTANFTPLAPFWSGNPAEPSAWLERIKDRQSHTSRGTAIAPIVGEQQRRRGAPPAAIQSAQRLANPQTVAIITGQQAGLFGGPLYTLLKALTTLKLAEQISREHDVPVVPIFWIEAEDHDWDEVRACTVFDAALAPCAVSLPARSNVAPARVADVVLDASASAVLDEIEALLPPTEFRDEVLAGLRSAYTPGVGMSEAFGRWIERVLGHRGLVVYDAADLAAKPLARDVFARELRTAGETGRRAARAGSELAALGYHEQVTVGGDAVALFYLEDGRHPIRQTTDGFLIGERSYGRDQLIEEVEAHPERFSPGVLLRPIVQDAIFPTICYVAGPNELAYLGQLRGVYEHFSVPMPLIYPRASATLVDSAALRFLTKHDLPFEALQHQDEAALNALLAAQMPETVETAFTDACSVVERAMTRLAEAMPALDPTLEGAARSTLGRMQHDLQTLHGKMIQTAKRRDETLRRQFTRTRALTFPDGHPQERTIGFISFLNQYGPALIDRLDSALPLDLGQHWIVTV